MQGAPKEVPRRRQTRAFTKVGDLLSKPSETVGIIMNVNLDLVEHFLVRKNSFTERVAFSGLSREDFHGSSQSVRA